MARGLISLAVMACVLLLVGSSMQLGTLWVNQIWGNSDTRFVNVEDVRIDDNTVYVDFVNQLGTNGVNVEQTLLQAGSVRIPNTLQVDQTGTISGRLFANGGIFADDSVNGGYSFSVEDNTGVTTISGELRPNGGINVDNGRFTVSGTTGETIIDTAPLRPNGGIDSNFGQFTVNKDDGSVLTKGQFSVNQDIVLGTNLEEDRSVRRVPAASRTGGSTIIQGQDGLVQGGNLELIPGYAKLGSNHGSLILGRAAGDDLIVTRPNVAVAAGKTTITGQSSTGSTGGDLIIRGGFTSGVNTKGGNLYLIPGTSKTSSTNGDIILGGTNDDSTTTEFDLTVRRPNTVSSNGGATNFVGQTSTTGNGGDIVIAGGMGTTKATTAVGALGAVGGDVVLLPGIASTTYGKIVLGRNDNDELYVTRVSSVGNAGTTFFKGQDSGLGNGGDLRIIAGDAAVDPNVVTPPAGTAPLAGGDIHLITGLATNPVDPNTVPTPTQGLPGSIFWGTATQSLEVKREVATTGAIGTATSIIGQNSAVAAGGSVTVQAGRGTVGSGNLVFQVPADTTVVPPGTTAFRSGTISVLAGDAGTNAKGGDVRIFAGNSIDGGNGGVVSISAGNAVASTGGNVILQAGQGATSNGKVIVKSGASLFLVDQAPVVIDGGVLSLTRGAQSVVLSADPNAILTVNGKVILKQRITQTILGDSLSVVGLVGPFATKTTDQYLEALQKSLNSVIRALSPCGHGLFNVYDPAANRIVTDSADAFCKATLNKRRNQLTVNAEGYDPLSAKARSVIKCGRNSVDLATPLPSVVAQTNIRSDNTATSSANPALPSTAPPLAYLVNDPKLTKCLMYNDAVSGPVVDPAAKDTVLAPALGGSFGVNAEGYVHDQATDPTKF